MNDETIERFLELCKDLRREAMQEEHARDLEILVAADKLAWLIPMQISSLERRLKVLQRMLEVTKMARDAIQRKQEELENQLDAPIVPSQSSQACALTEST